MTLAQAHSWKPNRMFRGHLVDHPALRTREEVLFDRRLAQLEMLHAVASQDRSVELEPAAQEAR